MGLITMGYGHLTIITMGLGNSIRIARQERFRSKYGTVEFQDTTPMVRISNVPIGISLEKERIAVEVSKKPKAVSFEDEEHTEEMVNG